MSRIYQAPDLQLPRVTPVEFKSCFIVLEKRNNLSKRKKEENKHNKYV